MRPSERDEVIQINRIYSYAHEIVRVVVLLFLFRCWLFAVKVISQCDCLLCRLCAIGFRVLLCSGDNCGRMCVFVSLHPRSLTPLTVCVRFSSCFCSAAISVAVPNYSVNNNDFQLCLLVGVVRPTARKFIGM